MLCGTLRRVAGPSPKVRTALHIQESKSYSRMSRRRHIVGLEADPARSHRAPQELQVATSSRKPKPPARPLLLFVRPGSNQRFELSIPHDGGISCKLHVRASVI